jgi:hypothetical protein
MGRNSARLPANPEAESVYQGLNLFWCAGMPSNVMKDNRQQERTPVLPQGHPFVRKHHTRAAIYLNDMMVIVDKFFGLLARADGDRLIGVDLIEMRWTGQANTFAFCRLMATVIFVTSQKANGTWKPLFKCGSSAGPMMCEYLRILYWRCRRTLPWMKTYS